MEHHQKIQEILGTGYLVARKVKNENIFLVIPVNMENDDYIELIEIHVSVCRYASSGSMRKIGDIEYICGPSNEWFSNEAESVEENRLKSVVHRMVFNEDD